MYLYYSSEWEIDYPVLTPRNVYISYIIIYIMYIIIFIIRSIII